MTTENVNVFENKFKILPSCVHFGITILTGIYDKRAILAQIFGGRVLMQLIQCQKVAFKMTRTVFKFLKWTPGIFETFLVRNRLLVEKIWLLQQGMGTQIFLRVTGGFWAWYGPGVDVSSLSMLLFSRLHFSSHLVSIDRVRLNTSQ